jgi:Lrp/AsnC family transcriptional regulator for asnA, asnC and gidA
MIDAMDKKLVRALNANARKSFREIAKELGTSTTSVIRGIKKLESAGAIQGYIPVVDPAAFGFDLTVVILLTINQGRLLETQRRIAQDPHVAAVLDITGEWDSLVIAHFQGREDLNDFLKKINAMRNVSRTMTNIALNTIKNERRIFC